MKVCTICQRCYDGAAISCVESDHAELSEIRNGSPEMISGYRLDMLLESGIKGETYRARRIDSDQPCVIKIVTPNEENKQLFLRDAKTAAALFNECVADVYESGALESGEVFVVAEDAAGQTVRELLKNVGVPQLLTTVQVVRQAAEAVHALHLSGVMHRAIRPENIVLTTDVEHRLLVRIQNADLGGVIENSIVSNKFLIDSAVDSIRYFAPEQFSGEGSSARTDIYGLGIVFYEMLAGTPPFDSEKASGLIDMHRNQRPPDVKIDNFDLRMLVTHTLMESLQKRPDNRQSSANAFARQLRHIEQLATHSPTPPPAIAAPLAPPQMKFAVATASAAPQLAVVTETPMVMSVANVQPVLEEVESEPVASRVEFEAPCFTVEPVPLPVDEIEDISNIELDPVADELTEILEVAVKKEVAVTRRDVASAPRKSRLKRLKKQLRSFTAPLAAAVAASETLPVADRLETGIFVPAANTPEVVNLQTQPEEMTIASLKAIPRKIEWEQPEDDIPSIDEIVAQVSVAPKRIEWEQPEDDIPSFDEIMQVRSAEEIPELPLVHVVAAGIDAAPVTRAVRKIEWDQPVDDIPSMEQALEVLSMEPIAEAAFVQDEPKQVAIAGSYSEVPSVESMNAIPVDESEPEEITQVSASSRFTVDWERPTPWTALSVRSSDEVEFFPTLLGGVNSRKSKSEQVDSYLYAEPETRSHVVRRTLMIGGGFVAALALYFFGSDSVRNYFPTERVESAVVKPTAYAPILPMTGQTNFTDKETGISDTERPRSKNDEADRSRSKPIPAKAQTVESSEKPQPASAQSSVETTLVPSTLVISSKDGRISSKVVPQDRPVAKNTRPVPKRSDVRTRPRVVEDPRP